MSPFIVAEAGINHNGEIENSFRIIEVTKWVQVDAIKFQIFIAEEFCNEKSRIHVFFSRVEFTESTPAMLKRCEFNSDEWF